MSECARNGRDAEGRFRRLMTGKGWKVSNANRFQNIYEHWDLRCCKGNQSLTVDVKCRKKIKRSDEYPQDERFWVEFINVNGDNGWLVGKADFIAFEVEHGFVVIPRSKVFSLALKALIPPERSHSREGRKDYMALIDAGSVIQDGKFYEEVEA